MSKKLHFKSLLLLCGLIVGSLNAWAEDVTLTPGTNGSKCTVNEHDGIKVGTSSKGGDMAITVPANTTKLTLHAAAWKGVTGLSLNLSGANTTPTSISLTADDGISNNSPFTLKGNEDDFKFEITLGGITEETTIKLESSTAKRFVVWGASAEISGGGDTPTPSVSADNVEITYDATSGNITSTISNSVSGGVLSAAITAGNEGSWLTLGTVSGNTVPFTCAANDAKTERTATATLTYTYDTDKTVTKNVTVTQAGNPNIFDEISDIAEKSATYSVRGTVVAINSKAFVIGDGTGYVYTYLNAVPTVSVGDKVSVSGATGAYGHILQFTNTATITPSETSNYNNTPSVRVIDADAIAEYNEDYKLSDYVQFEGALTKSSNNYVITVGTASVRISYPTEAQATALEELLNKTVRVKGYFAGFSSSTFTAMLESVEEVIVPTIITTPTSFTDFSYEVNNGPSATQTFTVSGANLTEDITVSVGSTSDFEISSDDATYVSSLTIPSSTTDMIIYVRLKSGLEISEDYSGKITLTSAGADDVEMTLAGSVADKANLSLDFTDSAWGFPTDYETVEKTYTNGGYTITLGESSNGHKAMTTTSGSIEALIFGKLGASITLPALNFNVSKIKVYGNSVASGKVTFNIFDGDEAVSTEVTSSKITQTFDIAEDYQAAGTIYTLKVTNDNNCQITKIEFFGDAPTTVSVTIPDTKYTTFASGFAIDFSEETNITAYTAKVDGSVVKLSPISDNIVPANTGVILYAETAGEYSGKVTSGGSVSDNEMVAAVTETKVEYSADSKFNYILQGGVFKMATGAKLNAGKAYLATTYDVTGAGARELKIVVEGEATGIKAIETATDKNVYDLQGRKVAAPQKGLYIINGKKMIVK